MSRLEEFMGGKSIHKRAGLTFVPKRILCPAFLLVDLTPVSGVIELFHCSGNVVYQDCQLI